MSRFLVAFGLVTLLVAGGLSYLADGDPDGLEVATRGGCAAGQPVAEDCAPPEHALDGSPLAGYAVAGDRRLGGLAGVLGVIATLALASGLFRLLRRPRGGGT